MEYCPKCGGVMVPKKEKKLILQCAKCGFTEPYKGKAKETVIQVKKPVDVVIESQEEDSELKQESREAFLESYDLSEDEEGED